MAAVDGRIRWLDYHFDRLVEGCKRLEIPQPDRATIEREIAEHCPPNGRAVVKLIVTRGPGARGYEPPSDTRPTRILSISQWSDYPRAHYTDGIRVRVCALRLGENPALAGIKHLCRLEQVLARLELRGSGAQEGLLLDAAGRVIGGTSSNLFAVHGVELSTPALTRCGVRGVMRRAVLEAAGAFDELRIAERDLTLADIEQADELFMTNALFGIWPVAGIGERSFAPGPTTRALMQQLGYGPHA
jgi:4-amino-4-deoxychorismate lyase